MNSPLDLHLPHRLLLGPGPSMVHPRVLNAMATPLVGHLDPAFLAIMDEIQSQLRWVFQTQNRFTLPISGTGSAAMEATIVNLIEPGDSVIVGINGVFGTRLATMVERCGGKVIPLEAPWGEIIEPSRVREALQHSSPVKAVIVVHAETSTGALQPLHPLGELCQEFDVLFVVDAVTSLGGTEIKVDDWHIDACYSATQKCLSCPPGLAPVTFNQNAVDTVLKRHTPCQSWYLDTSLIQDYWSESKRTYHHTTPISMMFALREALRLLQEEGLQERFTRHQTHSQALLAGMSALGFSLLPHPNFVLPTLLCLSVPPSLDERSVRTTLLEHYGIEVGAGLGPLQGKVWRIGLMGESCRRESVFALLSALEELLPLSGRKPGTSLLAAQQYYSEHSPSP